MVISIGSRVKVATWIQEAGSRPSQAPAKDKRTARVVGVDYDPNRDATTYIVLREHDNKEQRCNVTDLRIIEEGSRGYELLCGMHGNGRKKRSVPDSRKKVPGVRGRRA